MKRYTVDELLAQKATLEQEGLDTSQVETEIMAAAWPETHTISFPPTCMGGFGNPWHDPHRVEEGVPCSICGLVWATPQIREEGDTIHLDRWVRVPPAGIPLTIKLEMPPMTWRMWLTEIRLRFWWHLVGKRRYMP